MPKLPTLPANLNTEMQSPKNNLSAIINNIKRYKSTEELPTNEKAANMNQVIHFFVFEKIKFNEWLVESLLVEK